MTDTEKTEQKKEILLQREQALEEKAALKNEIELIASALERIAQALRQQPELVTETPPIGTPYDPRKDLAYLDRQRVVKTCREWVAARETLRQAEKQLARIQVGTPQTRIELRDEEEEP